MANSVRREYVPTEVATFYDLYAGVDAVLSRCMERTTGGRQLGWASVGRNGRMPGQYSSAGSFCSSGWEGVRLILWV